MFSRILVKEKAKVQKRSNTKFMLVDLCFCWILLFALFIAICLLTEPEVINVTLTISIVAIFIIMISCFVAKIINKTVKYAKDEDAFLLSIDALTSFTFTMKYTVACCIIGLGLLLFIFPGVYLAYRLMFVKQIAVDKPKLGIVDTIKYSFELTKGIEFDLFILDLSFAWRYIIIICTFGVAMILLAPYILVTKAVLYDQLSKEPLC
ncbi:MULTISPECIES: DUF975 family protein [unclassified Breznakia]|uniref:DUF975 family protein n=1 Tax=unclassified Breznakia TaxID=2623764 RepID=UPI0024748059|nr:MULTISPECIES: DUF975 family protein [unclassified Breznakia]MDH6367480.1 putative membrane protein [Breznakia sp. PH1-1]MDH6404600.1 putative membrane protein [Breznakia sp. PF1-11]MDH6412309.1 putative membrane protein [Breznakia sp. PFB1-11]MDH6414647.1 putative membrane protein [Breznakia sp. PFB1-14]MDH6416958.1 putative membrane protein [Breznakia sp. PFB1-4]